MSQRLVIKVERFELCNQTCDKFQYSGTWFEIERYQQRDEEEADCMSSQYSWGFISRSFRIDRTGKRLLTSEPFTRSANALLSFPDANPTLGLLNVTYYADREADEVNYYIIATDYFQYAVGWGCEDLADNQSREFAWILSRTPELPNDPNLLARIETYVDNFLDRRFIRWTEQRDA
jgi:lipocalin